MFEELVAMALDSVRAGKFCEELRQLYMMPHREMVDWTQFPMWARPDCVTDLAHEG